MVRFNPLLLMSRLICINLQPADQTGCSIRLLRESVCVDVCAPPNFYDTESLLNGLEDSSHLALCRNKKKPVSAQEKWSLPVKPPIGF